MRKYVVVLTLVAGAVATLLVAAIAAADGGTREIRARGGLSGYQETPATLSTTGNGTFRARVNDDGTSFTWTLSYAELEGTVQQAHIHFGQRAMSGGISVFLCTNLGNAPPAPASPTQACPAPPATITGTADADDVIGPSGQGIEAGAFGELLAAIRAGYTYANVHTTKWPGGEIRGQLNERED
jgi:hypothetical protein